MSTPYEELPEHIRVEIDRATDRDLTPEEITELAVLMGGGTR